MAYQSSTHQIWWVMVCYDLAHQITCAKHTFSGRCDITPMVCCSFGGHSTPQFLQCGKVPHPLYHMIQLIGNLHHLLQLLCACESEYSIGDQAATDLVPQTGHPAVTKPVVPSGLVGAVYADGVHGIHVVDVADAVLEGYEGGIRLGSKYCSI